MAGDCLVIARQLEETGICGERWLEKTGDVMDFTGVSLVAQFYKDRQWVKSQKWLEHWDSRQPRLGFKAAKIVIYGARLCVR